MSLFDPGQGTFDKRHNWRRGGWPGWRLIFFAITIGGTEPWSRWKYLKWAWRGFILKWIKAPLSCKRGIHRINDDSDTGIGRGQERGTMDVWCADCDAMLTVPIDDVIGWWKADRNLAIWRKDYEQ